MSFVFPDKVISSWWRIEGHKLFIDDIKEIIEYKPEILIVGTGAYGMLKVNKDVVEKLSKLGIKLEIYDTGKAINKFNEYLDKGIKVIAALHLTC